MKTFKQFLKEDKKPLNESWNDKKLESDCEEFLMDVECWDYDKSNNNRRWADAYNDYYRSMEDHFVYQPLKGLNRIIFDDVKKAMEKAYKDTNKIILSTCKDLLKRLKDEHKSNEEERNAIESYIRSIENIMNIVK